MANLLDCAIWGTPLFWCISIVPIVPRWWEGSRGIVKRTCQCYTCVIINITTYHGRITNGFFEEKARFEG